MSPDFKRCERLAVDLLLSSNVWTFPFDVMDLNYRDNILFESMQNYCRIVGIGIEELLGKHNKDGFIVRRNDISLILYNEDVYPAERINWTLAHELAHVIFGHEKDGDAEEVEAHFFVANLFMPDAILYELMLHGVAINERYLIENFGVSSEAAEKKMNTLKRRYRGIGRPLYRRDELVEQFQGFIRSKIKAYNEAEKETQSFILSEISASYY